jgi:hypothetical protein
VCVCVCVMSSAGACPLTCTVLPGAGAPLCVHSLCVASRVRVLRSWEQVEGALASNEQVTRENEVFLSFLHRHMPVSALLLCAPQPPTSYAVHVHRHTLPQLRGYEWRHLATSSAGHPLSLVHAGRGEHGRGGRGTSP